MDKNGQISSNGQIMFWKKWGTVQAVYYCTKLFYALCTVPAAVLLCTVLSGISNLKKLELSTAMTKKYAKMILLRVEVTSDPFI